MNNPRYIIGIDLGTTHCVLAYTLADLDENDEPAIELFEIPQIVAPGELQPRPLLPSFLLLPGPHDVPEEGLALHWNAEIDYAVGEFARERGSELPTRLVSSAKSWLCHRGVDRTKAILPWDAPEDARQISPVDAAARLLEHIRYTWNEKMASDDPEASLEQQEIYLTVPASFDAVARELTVQAAQNAGLSNFTLFEEPQAAFYSWLESQDGGWRDQIEVGQSILVCDVGGGTTDLSLIEVTEQEGNLELRRVAVGDHILLGGDNMDLTLAYAVRAKLAQEGTQLDNWQFRGLWHSCRKAKERLLSDPDLDAEPIVVLGRGSSLIGGTIRTELARDEIETILLQGFFPIGEATDFPEKKTQVGVREMGLPYEQDPAVTRHLAEFLGKQMGQQDEQPLSQEQAEEDAPTHVSTRYPAAVLFNGGVMKAASMRGQVILALQKWSGHELRELESADLDTAVAMGATYYGLARRGRGIRIRAGTAQTYYIGVESSMPAVPGIPTPVNALCVAPFGMEEGSELDILNRDFGLIVGELAAFQLLASTTRKTDEAGQMLEDWSGEIQEVATLETFLPSTEEDVGGTVIPVLLQSRVTEIGTLEIWCIARDDERQWKLEFNIRHEQEES